VGELRVAADVLVVQKDLRHAVAARALDHLEGLLAVVGHIGLTIGDFLALSSALALMQYGHHSRL